MPLTLYGQAVDSRLLIGSALYPSPDIMQQAINTSGSKVVTLSLKRQNPQERSGAKIWQYLQASVKQSNGFLLPNTAGCKTAKEAVTLAKMSREIFNTDWIKLEVIGDDYNLQPDPIELLNATEQLLKLGFKVFPYCTDDLIICQKLHDLGCEVIMPWASPIGTGKGLMTPYNLAAIRQRLPNTTLIVDAGIGKPSDACLAMEMGYDGVLLNSAVALADNPVLMAKAFASAIKAGEQGYRAGIMQQRQTAHPSTPTLDSPFWHQQGTSI